MLITIFPSGPFETNAYLVACPETRQAAIIDPAPGSASALITAIEKQQLHPTKILLTHSHWDHIADTAVLKKKYNIPVYVHADDAPNLQNPGADQLPCWIEIEGVMPDYFLEEDQSIKIGNLSFSVIHTPGHSPGCVCFYNKDETILFSGDTLFKGTIGNLSFPTSRPDLMAESLKKLANLPKETKVFPGHGPSTTIQSERWLDKPESML